MSISRLLLNIQDPMHNDMIHSMTGFAGAILAWIAGKFTAVQEFIPASWWQGGVTVVFLSCLIYAVVHLNKALREEREALLKDRVPFRSACLKLLPILRGQGCLLRFLRY